METVRRVAAALAVAIVLVGAGCANGSPPAATGRDDPTTAPTGPAAPEQPGPSAIGEGTTEWGTRPSARPSKPRPAGAADATSAAARYGWTDVVARDDFTGSSLHPSWGVYDSPGNAGQGIRSPRQITLHDGVLRMTGTPDGTTAGMAWHHPRRYGRWEIRARFPAGCDCYHPVLLLWPVEHPWPAGGEIDYAEVFDGERQKLNFFLHYGADNRQQWAGRRVDMTRWHTFAVEWTPDHLVGFVDGNPFFRDTQTQTHPPGPMNQTVQLDWFPEEGRGTGGLEVDWAAIYRL